MTIDPADPSASLFGILPPLIMPFDGTTGRLAENALAEQARWMIAAGAAGVVVGEGAGTGNALTPDEHAAAISAAQDGLGGRRSLLAGLASADTEDALRHARILDGLGIDALLVTPAPFPDHSARRAVIDHFRALHGESGLPLLIDNTHRRNRLDTPLLLEAMDEVAGIIGVAQGPDDLEALAGLLLDLPDDKVAMSGIDALLYPSFTLGAHAVTGALTAALPHVCVALHRAVRGGDHETARGVHDCLLRLWTTFAGDDPFACARHVQNRQGLPALEPRVTGDRASEGRMNRIDSELKPILAMLQHFGRAA